MRVEDIAMPRDNPRAGSSLAFVCLIILGIMPIISNSRPADFDALSFAFLLSVWQLIFSIPFLLFEVKSKNKGIFGSHLAPNLQRRTIIIILSTGVIFGLSTFFYVLAVEKAGAVNAAIAIQAYPLFAILWETIFLKRGKTPLELCFTLLLLASLYYLATGGTWQIQGLSSWFMLALGIPFLWSIAHVIVKEVLDRTPITPAQVTFFRVLVSSIALAVLVMAISGPTVLLETATTLQFQKFALVMGLVYYIELIFWFYAVRYIAVSLASSITVPAPAVTMILAVPFLGEQVETYQMITVLFVVASLYGLIFAGARKAPQPA